MLKKTHLGGRTISILKNVKNYLSKIIHLDVKLLTPGEISGRLQLAICQILIMNVGY
jgi:predicted nucleotidyltransferase